jgi:diaminohydroxyphosphoribosylaminopyrimidine deaminase/5-amino-6-(5-phosphoribosylamino)uracil reductase
MNIIKNIMCEAILLAKRARNKTLPNPRVGAIIFDDNGRILGRGWHKDFGKAHAEVEAINDCIKRGHNTKGKNLCVTLEPCNHRGKTPPCTTAIIKSGIKKVYVGTTDDCRTVCGLGLQKLKKAGVQIKTGILEKECRELNPGFHKYNIKRLPFISVKAAISLNGIMGSSWFTSEASRRRVHECRASSDLVLTGVGTIRKDNPKFNSRLPKQTLTNNVAILDQDLELFDKYLKKNLNVFKAGNKVTVITSDHKDLKGKVAKLKQAKVSVVTTKLDKKGLIDLKTLIKRLGNEFNFREIMVEAGPTLTGSFITDAVKMVDRINIYVAPVILKEEKALPTMPKMFIDRQYLLENTLALEGHFDI